MHSVPLLFVSTAQDRHTRMVQLLVYEIAEGATLNIVHYDTVPIDIDVTDERCFDTRF